MVKTNNLVVKNTQGQPILNAVSVEIPLGRITCFLGASGAGKTTLFRSIVQLRALYEGSILIDGNEASSMRAQEISTHVGYVFQQFNLFPHLTAMQNCMQPLMVVQKKSADKAQKIAFKQLEFLGMVSYMNAYPQQLSGGQQQRVAIARALCMNPKTLLLDEPTASLDPFNTNIIQGLVKQLAQAGIAVGISSHDTAFVSGILDRVYFIEQGRVLETFDAGADQLAREKFPKITRFMGGN